MSALSRRRLQWLLRARGTDMAAWPRAEREAALALLRHSAEARLALAEAMAGEDAEAVAEGDGAVLRRMHAALRRRLAPLSPAARGLLAGVLVACVAAGLFLAVAVPTEADGSGDPFIAAQFISVAALDQ